MIESFDRKKI